MSFFIRRKASLVAGLLLICLAVTACGGSANSGQTSGNSSASLTTLKVCQLNKSINFFPFYVAQQKGYLKANGLNIPTPPLLQVGSKVVDSVESGECDLGNGVITDAFNWAKADSSARIIGSFMDGYVVDIVVSKKLEQDMHVSATSPLADKVKALKGKTIAITGAGTGTQALVTYLFHLQGMDASKDVTEVSLGSNNAAALAALKSGRVDALSFFSPIGQAAEAQGIGDIFISPVRGDIPDLTGDVHGIIYTKQSTIDSKGKALAAYIKAVNQAEVYIQNNTAEAKALLKSYLGLAQNISDAVYAACSAAFAKTPVITQAEYTAAAQFHLKGGLVKTVPDYNQLIAVNTISSALA